MRGLSGVAMAMGLLMAAPAGAQAAPVTVQPGVVIPNPYGGYEFLIGDWDTASAGGPAIHQSFRWGPKRSYIFYSTLTRMGAAPEAVHFEGLMVWNAGAKAVDYLFVIEPGSGGQEKGTMRVDPDGSVVRDVTLTRGDGKTAQFRQVFRQTGPDTAVTSLMRRTATGWEPNFPGSEALAMVRRPA